MFQLSSDVMIRRKRYWEPSREAALKILYIFLVIFDASIFVKYTRIHRIFIKCLLYFYFFAYIYDRTIHRNSIIWSPQAWIIIISSSIYIHTKFPNFQIIKYHYLLFYILIISYSAWWLYTCHISFPFLVHLYLSLLLVSFVSHLIAFLFF